MSEPVLPVSLTSQGQDSNYQEQVEEASAVCGQATDVAQIALGRFDRARGLHYRLVQHLLRIRRTIGYQAGLKVHRAEERMGALSNEVARMIYLNELFALERRCPSQLADDSDQEVTPTY